MVLAAAVRVTLLRTLFARIDSDQAIIGIMAYHIAAGDRPMLYYGQPYQSSVEAYLAVPIFRLFGASDFAVRVPALLFSVLFVGAVYALGAMLYGRVIAVLGGLYVAVGPALLLFFSTAAGFGYIEASVAGTLLLLLATRYPDLATMPLPPALGCGLLIGFGIWAEPMMVVYLVPFALAMVVGRCVRREAHWKVIRPLAALVAGSALGGAPLLAHNLRNGWDTLTFLQARGPGGDHLAAAIGLITHALPVILGLATPTLTSPAFSHLVASCPLQYVVGLLAGCVLALRVAYSLPSRIASMARQTSVRDAPGPWGSGGRSDGVLALFVVCCLAFFVGTHFGAQDWAPRLPRYLLPLYSATPLVLACLAPRRWSGRQTVLAAMVAAMLLLGATVTLRSDLPPAPPAGVAGTAFSAANIDGLVTILDSRHIHLVYASYWLVYTIAFETHERVVGVTTVGRFRLGQNRIPDYPEAARNTPVGWQAWIFYSGSGDARAFAVLLHRRHVHARRWLWKNLVIYTDFSRPLRAPLAQAL